MDSSSILLINAGLYTIVLFGVILLYKNLNVGLCLWSFYTISAWASFLFYQHPYTRGTLHDNPLHFDALLYLFVVLLLFISPFFKVRKLKKRLIDIPYFEVVGCVLIGIIALQVILTLINFPQLVNIMQTESSMLLDYRENMYEEGNSLVNQLPMLNRINLIYSGLKPICLGFSVFLFFCYKKHRFLVITFLFSSLLQVFTDAIIQVSRGVIVSSLLYIFIIFVYIRSYIGTRDRYILLVTIVPILFFALSFFWVISVSRFGNLATFMLYKYLGEPMVNFSGILYPNQVGTTDGTAYLISAFRQDFMTGEEKWTYIENIIQVPSFIFYTFVGGFLIEFGKIHTFIIAMAFFFVQKAIICKSRHSIAFIFILCFCGYFYTYGVFLFVLQKFMGLFNVFFTISLYIIFRIFHQQKKRNLFVHKENRMNKKYLQRERIFYK